MHLISVIMVLLLFTCYDCPELKRSSVRRMWGFQQTFPKLSQAGFPCSHTSPSQGNECSRRLPWQGEKVTMQIRQNSYHFCREFVCFQVCITPHSFDTSLWNIPTLDTSASPRIAFQAWPASAGERKKRLSPRIYLSFSVSSRQYGFSVQMTRKDSKLI